MKPRISVVVVSWNIERELPKTIFSLSPIFQRGISGDEYEIIVVDNGSSQLPDCNALRAWGAQVTVLSVDTPHRSPVRAIKIGLNASTGKYVGVFIDGARIASPGLLERARSALSLYPRAVVASRGRYLGPKRQRDSIREGYDRHVEDALLERINWKHNGYGLFDISIFDEGSGPTWFNNIAESNGLFMSRTLWAELGGYDEQFQEVGGGLVNLDTWERACELPDVTPVTLLGEATFHQVHGGVMTNQGSREKYEMLHQEYIRLRGKQFVFPDVPLTFFGSFRFTPRPWELTPMKEEEQLSEIQRQTALVQMELQHERTRIQAMEQSKSWRVTAPLRIFTSKARDVVEMLKH
jgi:glycosyltransferase involved in cell wall biosynthesis